MDLIQDIRLINLYSRDGLKQNGSFNSDIDFYFSNILSESEDILYSSIGINNAEIPISFYIINNTNNILNVNSVSQVNLTLGNYNSNSLIGELRARFLEIGLSIDVVINKITGKLIFTSSTSFKFDKDSSLLPILGFLNDNYESDLIGTRFTLNTPHPLNLLGIKTLKIISSSLACYNSSSSNLGQNNTIASIPVNAPPFGLLQYENHNSFSILKQSRISLIDIKIKDEKDNLIDMNNIDWHITLKLSIFRKIKNTNSISSTLQPTQSIKDIKKYIENNEETNKEKDKEKDKETKLTVPESNKIRTKDTKNTPLDELDTLLYNN
jgi:hypothetical protein